ncbi:uncharacterized protein UBRO_20834 [Ustilago bromivora]|uniref:Reverse transcriptase domain-containing protein n=1 Tax=Ustilago bromivora TaxID=307758 RepID=A0A1K0GUY2_9BASI|nr:uncharacterized protein UBRO_20834 [Ustilago bromivora]
MSCLLYNFSLQPMLDYVKHHHHAGTELNWDTSNPMFVSSLAFADDILLIVNNRYDLGKFLDALDLYGMASNAQINEDKSQAFFFAKGQSLAEDGLEGDIPYPILGDSHTKIVHLGYPFCLDGGIPQVTIERQLASIQAKVNILSAMTTTLLARACIVNAFLLSKLWHTIRLCPIPYTLQRHLNSIINPFLFLGQCNWIHHAYIVTPQHFGGLGVIDTNTMSIVLIGQMATNFLHSKEPIDWNSIMVQELLTLLFYNDMFGYTWLAIHEANTKYWEHNGLRVWGDLLWYNPNERGKVKHPYVCTNTYPLVPLSPAGCKNNYVASRGHPNTYECFSSAAGQLLPRHWIDMWAKLHLMVRSKLLDISKTFALHPDHSKSTKNPRPHDNPFNINTVGLPFPKHLTMFAEKHISAYTVKHACSFLSPNKVVVPQWPFESTSDQWQWVWEWHNNDSLLSSEASSDVFLFLHSHPWLAQKPRGDRQLTNYNILNKDTIALRILMHQDHGNPNEALEAINDTYKEEHVFGVSSCMLCSGPKDSTIHGFIECDLAQQHIWKPLLGTLRCLCGGRGVPTDARNIVLGWPDLKMPTSLRARLLLWRNLTVHMLSQLQSNVIKVGLQNDHCLQLTLINFISNHAALVTKTITNAYYKQPQRKRPVFSRKWIVGRTFLQVVNDTIHFHLMSNPTPNTSTNPTSELISRTTYSNSQGLDLNTSSESPPFALLPSLSPDHWSTHQRS